MFNHRKQIMNWVTNIYKEGVQRRPDTKFHQRKTLENVWRIDRERVAVHLKMLSVSMTRSNCYMLRNRKYFQTKDLLAFSAQRKAKCPTWYHQTRSKSQKQQKLLR